jgi:hypothetical protein
MQTNLLTKKRYLVMESNIVESMREGDEFQWVGKLR